MNRRSFLSSILALGVAPAIVRADSLMRIVPRGLTFIAPTRWVTIPIMMGQVGAVWHSDEVGMILPKPSFSSITVDMEFYKRIRASHSGEAFRQALMALPTRP